jgi:predicted nuclease of predicted toxin-antitoxin system
LTLKFKLDENMPSEAAAMLIAAGYDALTVSEQQLGGRPDLDVAAVCRHEDRAIVTLDLDFSDIRAYPPADYSGIIVLRLARLDKRRVLATIQRLLPLFGQESIVGRLWIVEEATVRIRG